MQYALEFSYVSWEKPNPLSKVSLTPLSKTCPVSSNIGFRFYKYRIKNYHSILFRICILVLREKGILFLDLS